MKIVIGRKRRPRRGPFASLFDSVVGIGVAAFVLAVVFLVVLPVVGVALTAVVGLLAGGLVILAMALPFLSLAKRRGYIDSKVAFAKLQNPSTCAMGRQTLSASHRVSVENQVGNVEVLGVEGGPVVVEALGGASFEYEAGDDVAFVQRLGRDRVDMVVRLPRDVDVEVAVGMGSVTLRGLGGAVHVKLGNGHVELEEVLGSKTLELGAVSVEGRRLAGNAHIRAGSGRLSLSYVRTGVSIDVATGAGSLDLELPPEAKVAVASTMCRVENPFENSDDADVRVKMVAASGELCIRKGASSQMLLS